MFDIKIQGISVKLWILAAILIEFAVISKSPSVGFIMGVVWTVIVFETWKRENPQ